MFSMLTPIHGRWNQHTSAETELEYTNLRKSWASQTDVVFLKQGYWEIFVVTSLGGGNSNMFLFPPRSLGKWSNLTSMVFRMQKCWLPAISRLLLCCNPPGAGERRKCVTWPCLFSWNANGEWTEVIADPPKKKTGLVTRLFSFWRIAWEFFGGEPQFKKTTFFGGWLGVFCCFFLLEGWVDLPKKRSRVILSSGVCGHKSGCQSQVSRFRLGFFFIKNVRTLGGTCYWEGGSIPSKEV